MTLELLQIAFKDCGDISPYVQTAVGEFSLTDVKACNESKSLDICRPDCNQAILTIFAPSYVTIVNYDSWRLNNHQSQNEKCDYIIFDSELNKNKFAFCELTCSREQYVNRDDTHSKIGKRAKAFSQMRNSLKEIVENPNPTCGVDILQYKEKVGLFGWRERNVCGKNPVIESLKGFIATPGSLANIKAYPEYIFGKSFTFIQVKYPAIYHWE